MWALNFAAARQPAAKLNAKEPTMTADILAPARPRPVLGALLWLAQGVLAFFFLWGAYMKLGMPPDEAVKMAPWVGAHPGLARFTGVVDLLGGVGIVLPALLRIRPRLSVLAAAGIVALQVLAMGFHLMRGEAMVVPMNLVLLALAGLVLWGRTRAVPFAPGR